MPPTVPPQSDTTPKMPDIKRSPKERVLGAVGGVLAAGGHRNYEDTALGKALADHHKKRQDEASMYWEAASKWYGLSVGAYDQDGNPMTDEKRQEYRNKGDAAYAAYAKIAGFSKESKAAIAQGKQKLDQGLPFLQQHVQKQVSPTGALPGGMTPPPSMNAQEGTPASSAPAQPTPPPSLSRGDVMAPPDVAHGQAVGEQRALAEQQHKYKMEEERAKPHHLQRVNFKRPNSETIESGSFDPLDGKFYDQNDQPVEGALAVTPSASTPKRFVYLDKDNNPRFGMQEGEELFDLDHNKLPADTKVLMRGLIGTETVTKDQFGNITVSVRTPMTGTPDKPHPSKTAPAGGSAPAAKPAAPASSTPTRPGAGAGAGPGASVPAKPSQTPSAPSVRAESPTGPLKGPTIAPGVNKYARWGLDPNGNIPAGVGNPQVREAAQQLLDGTDKDKLPLRAREPAGMLARQFGWSQGKFTPKEQVMLKEATTFLEEAENSPLLSVLDEGFWQRLKTGEAAVVPSQEHGLFATIGRAGQELAARHTTDKEAEFIALYNQLTETISGLVPLVRTNRATEATINRLINTLPNPYTTKNSAQARLRIRRLLREIDVAMDKGTFEYRGNDKTSAFIRSGESQATPTPAKGGPTPPPSISKKTSQPRVVDF